MQLLATFDFPPFVVAQIPFLYLFSWITRRKCQASTWECTEINLVGSYCALRV